MFHASHYKRFHTPRGWLWSRMQPSLAVLALKYCLSMFFGRVERFVCLPGWILKALKTSLLRWKTKSFPHVSTTHTACSEKNLNSRQKLSEKWAKRKWGWKWGKPQALGSLPQNAIVPRGQCGAAETMGRHSAVTQSSNTMKWGCKKLCVVGIGKM